MEGVWGSKGSERREGMFPWRSRLSYGAVVSCSWTAAEGAGVVQPGQKKKGAEVVVRSEVIIGV